MKGMGKLLWMFTTPLLLSACATHQGGVNDSSGTEPGRADVDKYRRSLAPNVNMQNISVDHWTDR